MIGMPKSGAFGLGRSSPTAELSNTVAITDAKWNWPVVDQQVVSLLSEFGEIARLDTSLVTVAGCLLVTFFDVRCSQRLMLSGIATTKPFPPAAHDCRTVRVNMLAFAERVGEASGGFSQFGELADISLQGDAAIVEFYDIRSGHMLLAASQGTAVPWVWQPSMLDASKMESPEMTGPEDLLQLIGAEPLAGLLHAAQGQVSPEDDGSLGSPQDDKKGAQAAERGNRPLRTKVSNKEFQKYDIDVDRIQLGKDPRTTVMVRNIPNGCSRKCFLQFLEKNALGDRFTFFYMPCKEHRNVPAGFAFINFVSPMDVLKLFVLLKTGSWSDFMKNQSKAPALSYARFQGHQELSDHFSSSAVLHEQDPEKRPIFRPENLTKSENLAMVTPPALQMPASFMPGGYDENPGLGIFGPGEQSLDKLGNLKGMHETSSQVDKGKISGLPMYLKPDNFAIGA
ncbi:ML4 [Symbiodinium natans]|uniref:ML4 protein n=1 Tax=Symbiodinium natans TaxID=878477 RepID=A0A812Q1K9_9DINO|nr:ML4 [Symbiodinium natans]